MYERYDCSSVLNSLHAQDATTTFGRPRQLFHNDGLTQIRISTLCIYSIGGEDPTMKHDPTVPIESRSRHSGYRNLVARASQGYLRHLRLSCNITQKPQAEILYSLPKYLAQYQVYCMYKVIFLIPQTTGALQVHHAQVGGRVEEECNFAKAVKCTALYLIDSET